MKTAKEMLAEHEVVQEGFLKGAKITLTGADIIKLMEDYHAQKCKSGSEVKSFLIDVYKDKDKLEAPIIYKNICENCTSLQFCGWAIVFDNETGEYFFSDTSGG